MVYDTYNELVTGANLNQLITGGPHIVDNLGTPGSIAEQHHVIFTCSKNIYASVLGM